jgi:hypothetical protein
LKTDAIHKLPHASYEILSQVKTPFWVRKRIPNLALSIEYLKPVAITLLLSVNVIEDKYPWIPIIIVTHDIQPFLVRKIKYPLFFHILSPTKPVNESVNVIP